VTTFGGLKVNVRVTGSPGTASPSVTLDSVTLLVPLPDTVTPEQGTVVWQETKFREPAATATVIGPPTSLSFALTVMVDVPGKMTLPGLAVTLLMLAWAGRRASPPETSAIDTASNAANPALVMKPGIMALLLY